ncbi:MAG: hypothetical protein JKY09_09620 [Crocinitomicaceae bacterium]|nr:hypothetical protein [Crocinitomicaceae bacterium]
MDEFTKDELYALARYLIIVYVTDDKTTETIEINRLINRMILDGLNV